MAARMVRQEGNIAVYDLLGSGDQDRVEKMLDLYYRLFPQYQHYIPRMRRRAQFQNEHRAGHIVHYWLIEVDGEPAGLRTFRYVRNRHCGLAHALAVDPNFRKVIVNDRRLAVYIIYECLAQVIQDAQEDGNQLLLGMVNEVELDKLMEHYIHNGLIQLPLKYVEPIFPPEKEGRSRELELLLTKFSPMHIGFLPNPKVNIEKYDRVMIQDFVKAYLMDHYGLPEDHPKVLEVIKSICS